MKNFSLKAAFFKVFLPFLLMTAFAQEANGQANTKLDEEFTRVACKVDTSSRIIGIRYPVSPDPENPDCLQGEYTKEVFGQDSLRILTIGYEVTPQDGSDRVSLSGSPWVFQTLPYPEGVSAADAFDRAAQNPCAPCDYFIYGRLER